MTGRSDVSVVVLAGGRGTRLQGLYPDLPKPMIPVAGAPFLHWLTQWLARHGLDHFVYSTGHLSGSIEDWVGDATLPGLAREFVREDEPLGTGGGLFHCLDRCRDWILVANGDGLVMSGISDLLALTQSDADGGILGVTVDDTARFGSLAVSAEDRLMAFREKVPGRGLINGGLYLFRTNILREMRQPGNQSIEYDLIPGMLQGGHAIQVVRVGDSPFIDIGTPETLAMAEAFVRTHLVNEIEDR